MTRSLGQSKRNKPKEGQYIQLERRKRRRSRRSRRRRRSSADRDMCQATANANTEHKVCGTGSCPFIEDTQKFNILCTYTPTLNPEPTTGTRKSKHHLNCTPAS